MPESLLRHMPDESGRCVPRSLFQMMVARVDGIMTEKSEVFLVEFVPVNVKKLTVRRI